MLQWMGGSRRKVTASRNSTLKRQKQYFEQRKKQQQQAAVLESSSKGYASGDSHKEQCSLDVLSLLTLSTVAQECCSISLGDVNENLEVDASGVNYSINTHQPIAFTDCDACQLEEAGRKSINQVEIQSSKKVCPNLPDDHENRCNRNNSLHDHWNTPENELSVLELLCDEGLQNSERSQIQEDHVSFSVEGIGRVATETPAHSPRRPRRMCPYDYPSPLKAAKQPRSSENLSCDLELEVDAIMQDIDASLCGNTLELPSYSRSRTGSFSSRRQKLYNLEDLMQLDDHTSTVKSSYTNRKIFNHVDDVEQNIYNAGCGFHSDGFLDKSRSVMLPRDWPSQMDDKTIDFLKLQDNETYDFSFDEPYQYNKRFSMVMKNTRDGFPILDSAAPYHKISANGSNTEFMADLPRCHSHQTTFTPAWERACSSFTSAENQHIRQSGNKFVSRKYGVGSLNMKEISSGDSFQPRENATGSGKYTKTSNHSILRPSHSSRFALQNNIESGISWLFKEEHPSLELSLGINTYCQTPYTKYTSSDSNLQSREFGAFSVSELEMNIKTRCQKFSRDDSLEYFRSGFLSKELSFGWSFDDVQYGNSFVKPDIVSDSLAQAGPLPVAPNKTVYQESQEFLDFSLGEQIGRDQGKERKIQTSDNQYNQPGKQFTTGNEALSLEDENDLGAASGGKDYSCGYEEANIRASLSLASPEFAEETSSSSVMIPDDSVSSDNRRECEHEGEASVMCPNGNKGGY